MWAEGAIERTGVETKFAEQDLRFAQTLRVDQLFASLVVSARPILGLPDDAANRIQQAIGHLIGWRESILRGEVSNGFQRGRRQRSARHFPQQPHAREQSLRRFHLGITGTGCGRRGSRFGLSGSEDETLRLSRTRPSMQHRKVRSSGRWF